MEEKTMKEKKGFWSAFISFLAMGGFLVVLVVGVVIAVIVSHLTNQLIEHGLMIRISESNPKIEESMAQGRKNTMVRKRQIMDAARKLIMRSGSEHVTIKNMAKEVGISDSAIYRHFKSKTEILSFLADHVSEGLIHDIKMARKAGFNSMNIIDEILRTHLSKIKQKRGLSFLVLAEIISFGDKSLNKKVSDNIRVYVDHLRLVLSDGVRAGVVRQDVNLEAAALLLFGMIQGLVNIWALNAYKFDLVKRYSDLWGVCRRSLAY